MIIKYLALLILFLSITYPVSGKNDFILGNETEEGTLVYPIYEKEGPDGNIYVYDQKDAFIKVYSASGKFLRKIGGPGEGPGLIKRSDMVTFGFTFDKKLYFTEFFGGHPWITFMTLDGRYLNVLTPKIKENFYGISWAESLPDGSFLVEISFVGVSEKVDDYFLRRSPVSLFWMRSTGDIIAKIKESNYFTRISYLTKGADIGLPFIPIFRWSRFKKDSLIYADGTSKNLSVSNYKGRLIKEIKTGLSEPGAVTKDDLEKWRTQIKNEFYQTQRGIDFYKQYGKIVENYTESVYKKKPFFENLSITPDGNIILTGVPDEKKRRDFWLIDEKGKILAKITMEAESLNISKHFVFIFKRDRDENEYIYCSKRKGTEITDFQAISREL